MPTFTPRLQLPRPTLDEPADGPDGFNDLTDVLDPNTSIFLQGTAAARPAASIAGRFYWNTDTATLEYDDGAAWHSTTNAPIVSGVPVLDVGVQGQIRAGRQLTVADFTAIGLAQPLGLWNLSDLANLGSDGRALANKGAVPFGVGINGLASTAAVFAGSTSQALYIPDSGAADPLRIKTGSFGAWHRTAKSGVAQYFIVKASAAAGQRSYGLALAATDFAQPAIYTDGTASVTANGTTPLADDRWHFIVATIDGTELRVYVDGELEGVAATSALPFSGSGPLNIGAYGADAATAGLAGGSTYGRVDEAFITADVLSEEQVRALYCAKLAHGLGVTPTRATLNVTRRKRGGPLAVADFPTQPLRLHNFTGSDQPSGLNDEGSNGVALAFVGTGAAMVATAGADGARNGAYAYAGGGHLAATDAGLPAVLASRSYGCWFKTMSTASACVLGYGTQGTADVRLVMVTAQGVLAAQNGSDAMNGSYVADGQWHFVVVTEDNVAGDGVRRKLYIDGRLVVGSTVMNAITLAGANRFRVGANPDGTGVFTGQVDGAFVTGVALTAADVARLYAKASQALAQSPKETGAHVEAMDATSIHATFDTLDPQHAVDLGVA